MDLQALFGRPSDDPMYECYPIGAQQAPALEPGVGQSLVSDGLTWFLEADAIDE